MMGASGIHPFFPEPEPGTVHTAPAKKNCDGFSEEQVFRKDPHSDQDKNQPAGELHFYYPGYPLVVRRA